MSVFNIWEIRGFTVPKPFERTLKVILSPETTGTKELTFLVSIIPPNSTTGPHIHEANEIMYVASGRGVSLTNDKKSAIQLDSVIFVPKNVEHEIKNTGEETLKLICVFFPPLKPEGNLRRAIDLAKKNS